MLLPFSKLSDDELVARFVLPKSWVRRKDQSVKQDAFVPYPHTELSVTRHKNISVEKLWKHGKSVAKKRKKSLLGRADVRISDVRNQNIEAAPRPILWKNWNHACLTGWPPDKPLQKMIAQQLAAQAQYVAFEV